MTPWRGLLSAAAVVLAALLAAPAPSGAQARRLNVLFLSVDDLRPVLGCYGDPIARTPHLDRLARESVRFERAYCQYPLCNPSRTSMLTGRYPPATGVLDNLKHFRERLPQIATLPQHFRDSGYASIRAGKIFHGGIDDLPSWTEGGEVGMARAPRTPQQAAQYRMQSDRWVALDSEGEDTGDYRTASAAVRHLEKYRDRPFFLAVGFAKPHTPLIAPKKYFDLYDAAKMPLPPDFAASIRLPAGAPEGALGGNGDLFIGRDATEQEAREMIRGYYACASFIDAQVGRILEVLDRLRLRENTVIAFWGDHGFHLGEKGKWSKHNSLYDAGTRVPVMIAAPGIARGKASPRTVGLIDLYPTLAELCGLPLPAGLEGRSLVPLLKDPNAAWDRPAYSYTRSRPGLGQAVRTERYRYISWEGGRNGAELYDHEHDPHETRNVASDPAYAAVVEQMKSRLR